MEEKGTLCYLSTTKVVHYVWGCNKDRNPLINNSLREDRNTPTKVLFILLRNQFVTPSPDEDQQYSGRNVAVHIYVTQS